MWLKCILGTLGAGTVGLFGTAWYRERKRKHLSYENYVKYHRPYPYDAKLIECASVACWHYTKWWSLHWNIQKN